MKISEVVEFVVVILLAAYVVEPILSAVAEAW
jgi:archaellum component FlaG (FlaF/FlaG flagellin family)